MLENIENTMAHLAMDKLGQNLAGRIPSRSRHVRHNAVANSALNILQLWASEGRTRKPILMRFGIQQQIRTTRDQILKILKFKMADGRCWKIFVMP